MSRAPLHPSPSADSASVAALRAPLPLGLVLLRLALALTLVCGVLHLVRLALGVTGGFLFEFALVAFAWDFSLSLLVLSLVFPELSPAASSSGAPMSVSVLIAAWNEEASVVATLESVLAQRGKFEVLLGDDGSSDQTRERVIAAYALAEVKPGEWRSEDGRLRLFAFAHRGKGATLEALRLVAREPVLVTVDADTVLGEDALLRLASAFDDVEVEAAAGSVVVRAPSNALTHFQFAEYARNTLHRMAWSRAGVLEQVPGALAAIRATALARAGGFPLDSLTEDYEVAYRLYRQASLDGRRIRIPTLPSARAYTDPPRTFAGLVRQRTRWFAGFLITFWRFKGLLLAPRAGAFGTFRMPIKLLDACLPLLSLSALFVLLGRASVGVLERDGRLVAFSLALLVFKSVLDLVTHRVALRIHRRAGARIPSLEPSLASLWFFTLIDPWTYGWMRQLVVLRAYPFALAKSHVWEPSRSVARLGKRTAEEP